MFGFQEIGSSLVSFQMILEALQSELFRFTFHLLNSKIVKIPGFNLTMTHFFYFKGKSAVFVRNCIS